MSNTHKNAIILLGNYQTLINALKNNKSFPTFEAPIAELELNNIKRTVEELQELELAN